MVSQEKSVNSVVYTIFTFVLPWIDNFVSGLCLHKMGSSELIVEAVNLQGRADKRQVKNQTMGLAHNMGGEPYAPTVSVVIVGS